jgi:hypothetical protein
MGPLAGYWITVVRLAILVMALVEGLSWGHITLFITGNVQLPLALFVGAAVFFLVWLVDASLVMLDRGSHSYDATVFGKPRRSLPAQIKNVIVVYGALWALIGLSLTVTAPMIQIMIFQHDLDHGIEAEEARAIENKSSDIENKHDGIIHSLVDQGNKLSKWTREIAGVGSCGHRGNGLAAASLRERLIEVNEALSRAHKDKDSEIPAFENTAAKHHSAAEHDAAALRWFHGRRLRVAVGRRRFRCSYCSSCIRGT